MSWSTGSTFFLGLPLAGTQGGTMADVFLDSGTAAQTTASRSKHKLLHAIAGGERRCNAVRSARGEHVLPRGPEHDHGAHGTTF